MNCSIYQNQLEDFLYGELDATANKALGEHLSVCADCRQAQVALEREAEIFTQFYEENALEPSDEMWANIHARISDDSVKATQSSWQQKLQGLFTGLLAPALLRQFAFAAMLVIISVGLTALYFSTRRVENTPLAKNEGTPTPSIVPTISPSAIAPNNQAAPAPTAPAMPEKSSAIKPQFAALKTPAPIKAEKNPVALQPKSDEQLLALQIGKATREYQGAIRLLERAVTKRKTELDAGTIKQFEGSLALIDASIASSRQALREHPNDPAAGRYLLAAYSKKVELMQEIAMR